MLENQQALIKQIPTDINIFAAMAAIKYTQVIKVGCGVDANIKLSSVLTNVHVVTDTKIIADLIAGTKDAKALSKHYHGKIQASKKEMVEALNGKIAPHYQFVLKTINRSMADKKG